MAKVSVIINTVDRVSDLKRCLDSVTSQTYKDFEIIVVNNGTSPEARKFLESFLVKCQSSNVRCQIVGDLTKRLSYLFNLGWKNSDPATAYLAYLADDTEADPLWLESAVNYLNEHGEAGAVSGPMLSTANPPGEMNYLYDLAKKNIFTKLFLKVYEYFVMEGKTFAPGHLAQSGAFSLGAGIPQPGIKEPIEIDLLTSGNMVVRRSVMEEIKGFDENFLFNHADGDLFIRIKKSGHKLIFHPLVKVWHHMRFGPTRYPQILGRDTAFYYLKDVRPKSLRGWLGAILNLLVFNAYFIFKAWETRNPQQLLGISGFFKGIFEFFTTRSEERGELAKTLLMVAGFIGLFGYAFRNLWGYGMLAYGDATPFPNDFRQAFQFFFSAYDPRSPGILNPQDGAVLSSLVPLEAAAALLFGGNFIWAQRLFHFLPIPLSFATMYFFLSRFIESRPARFLASFAYAANHFMVAEFAGGFEGNLYVPALLPVFLFLLKRLHESAAKRRSQIKYLLIYSALLSVAYIISDHVLLILAPFWVLFVLAPWVTQKERRLRRSLENSLVLAASLLLVLILTIYHSYSYLQLAASYLIFKSFPKDVIPFFIGNVWDTYWKMGLGNTLRLGGSYFSDFFNGSDGWARVGFLIPALAFAWPLFSVNRRAVRFLIGAVLTVLALADITFITLTSQGVTIPLMTAFPVLFRFRNPSRLSLLLAFFYAPLVALTLDVLFTKLEAVGKLGQKLAFLAAPILFLGIFFPLAFYFKGFFPGDLTLKQHRGNSFWIGENYYELAKFIKREHQRTGFFRTLYIPWNHEEAEVKLLWLDPYTYSVPITYGAYVRNEYLGYMQVVYNGLANTSLTEAGPALAQAGVKYIVVNTKSGERGLPLYRFDYQTPWILGAPNYLRDFISLRADMRFVKNIGGFDVFENLAFSPDKIDVGKSAAPGINRPGEDLLRRVLILTSTLSWAFLFLALIKIKSHE